MPRTPTIQQAAFIEAIGTDEPGHKAVVARAGSGKTTTILDAVAGRPPRSSALLCAFNARIADELKARTQGWRGVTARTLHGIGLRAVNRYCRGAEIDPNREHGLAVSVCGDQEPDVVHQVVARLASSAKECAPDHAAEVTAIGQVGSDLGLLPDDDEIVGWPAHRLLLAAAAVVNLSVDVARDRKISFSDMLYVPLVTRTRPERHDLVIVDEAQDMNLAQLRLAIFACAQGGRFVIVGDDRQAIYSWRGAEPGALARVSAALKARTFKLTVTHRCARAIVEEARRIVPDLEAAPGAPDGLVRSATWKELATAPALGDFVIGRTNAVLAIACLRMLRAGTRARIVGSDIAKALLVIVDKLARGDGSDLIVFLSRLEAWREHQVKKAEARKSPAGAARARDSADTIAAIADDCDTSAEIRRRIADLFVDDGRGHVACSTVHKAKGLEADRVWMLDDSFNGPPAKTITEETEGQNLRYVATTRARFELVHVSGKPEENP